MSPNNVAIVGSKHSESGGLEIALTGFTPSEELRKLPDDFPNVFTAASFRRSSMTARSRFVIDIDRTILSEIALGSWLHMACITARLLFLDYTVPPMFLEQ